MLLTFTVPNEHSAIPGHFPGMPIVPAALLLDEITHRFALATGLKFNTVKQVRFTAPLVPGQQLEVQYQPKNSAEYRFIGTEKGNPVLKGALDYTVTEPKYVPPVSTPNAPVSLREAYRQLPHGGAMRLLDELVHGDAQHIICLAHAGQEHPLTRHGALPAWASLEYAAQALACHGLLSLSPSSPAQRQSQTGAGTATTLSSSFTRAMIIGVREMVCYTAAIDPDLPCLIEVGLVAQQPGAASCTFGLSQDGQVVSAGQLNVVYHTAAPGRGACSPAGLTQL